MSCCSLLSAISRQTVPDFVLWEIFVYPDTTLYNLVSDFVCTNGLTQLVDQPTRGNNILDYVFCTDIICCDNMSYIAPLANSDHCIVGFTLVLSFPESDDSILDSVTPNFAQANWTGLCDYLSSVNWVNELSSCMSMSSMWDTFMNFVAIGVSMYVPFHKNGASIRGRIHYPLRIKKLFKSKANCWRLYKKFPTTNIYIKYKRLSRACSCAVEAFSYQWRLS